MIALIAVIGFALVSCDNGSGGGGGDPISITITDIVGHTGHDLDIYLFNFSESALAIAGNENIDSLTGNSITFPIFDDKGEKFTRTGSYQIGLYCDDEGTEYHYTNGKTAEELGIGDVEDEEEWYKIPKYSFSGGNVSISFSKFK